MHLYHLFDNTGHSYDVVVAAEDEKEALRNSFSPKISDAPTFNGGGIDEGLYGEFVIEVKRDEGEDEILSLGRRCSVVRP